MNKYLPLLIPVSLFLFIKLPNLGVYTSDSGNYFYTAYHLLHQHVLYKDIFFTDLPFSPLIFLFYFLLFGGNFYAFEFMASIEAAAIAGMIYYLVYKKSHDKMIALLSTTLYLFSPLVFLVSSMTGLFSASLFILAAYLLIQRKQFIVAGILLGLSFLTKGYLLPLIVALLIATYLKYGLKATLRLIAGCLVTSLIILTPFLLSAGSDMWKDIVVYSSGKERSVPFDYLLWYFLSRDPLLAGFLCLAIFRIKKEYFLGLISLSFTVFFLFYQGMQPLYLAMIIPFVCLSLPDVALMLTKKFHVQRMVIPTVVAMYLCFTLPVWIIGQANIGKIADINGLVDSIVREKPNYIYGTNAVAPIIAYLTKVPLLRGQIDTDDGLYLKGLLNSHALTQEAVNNRAVFVISGYQEAGTNNFKSVGRMFDLTVLKPPKCKMFGHYQVQGNLLLNQILLIKCY